MLSVDKKTGEIIVTPYSKFMHTTVAREPGSMIIEKQDFSWSEEIRDFIVVDVGKEDRQAFIDSFKDDAGVYNILKKYAITGDVSLLNQREGFYGDISGLPVDELNPAARIAEAEKSVDALSKALGVELSSDKLASMSSDELNALIERAVAAKAEKEASVKEGE